MSNEFCKTVNCLVCPGSLGSLLVHLGLSLYSFMVYKQCLQIVGRLIHLSPSVDFLSCTTTPAEVPLVRRGCRVPIGAFKTGPMPCTGHTSGLYICSGINILSIQCRAYIRSVINILSMQCRICCYH